MALQGILTPEEIALGKECISFALNNGASQIRITLNKSLMDLFGTLDGHMDKVSHCLDRSIVLSIFADGKYGTFSSNRLEKKSLEEFILKAIDTVKMLAEDEFRKLPDAERIEKNASSGLELNLLDPEAESITADQKRAVAMASAGFGKNGNTFDGFKVISEEGEYSDTVFDSLMIDSLGSECRHTETSFEYGVEVTIQDNDGNKLSGYWWDASTTFKGLQAGICFDKAVETAARKIGPKNRRSGKYNLVVSRDCASKMIVPVINALSGFALQQNNSFLIDSLGKKMFSEGLTITDKCRQIGKTGSRLFDSEGVATKEVDIISGGVVNQYFINTYMSGKLAMEPTVEDAIRPCIQKYLAPEFGVCPEDFDCEKILKKCRSGILVTGFNGGNSNSSTGDFSYGIEGFAFKDGKITHPVKEMLITGNFLTLWNNFLAAGNDYRKGTSREIPTLAFSGVDFSS